MKEYTDFANVYDMFMDNVPYEEWGYYIVNTLKDYNIDNGIISKASIIISSGLRPFFFAKY